MGCMQSTAIPEADWSPEVKEAIEEVEGWDNAKALEAAKKAAGTGASKDDILKVAEEAKEAPEENEEEADKQAETPEGPVDAEATPEETPAGGDDE